MEGQPRDLILPGIILTAGALVFSQGLAFEFWLDPNISSILVVTEGSEEQYGFGSVGFKVMVTSCPGRCIQVLLSNPADNGENLTCEPWSVNCSPSPRMT